MSGVWIVLAVAACGGVAAWLWTWSLRRAVAARLREAAREEARLDGPISTNADTMRIAEDRFRAMFETTAAGMALIGMDGRYMRANARFCDILGFSEDELKERTWRDVTHPDDIAQVEEQDRRVAAGECTDFYVERRMIRKDGTVVWTNLSSSQMRDDAGQPNLTFSFIQDISGLKQAEEAVRADEANMRFLLDSGPVGITVLDQETTQRVFMNRQFVKMMGAESPDELSALPVDATYANPMDLEDFLEAALSGWTIQGLEVLRRRLDGSTFWCLQSVVPIGRYMGRPACVLWTVDISDVKDAEAEVARQKEIVDIALDNMGQGISMFDTDLKLAMCNDRLTELMGLPVEFRTPGTPIETFFRYNAERGDYGDGDIEQLVRARVDLARKFEPHTFQRETPDGRTIEVKGQPVPTGGFVTTYTDITSIVEAQKGARLLEEALDTFADMVILYDKNEKVVFTNDRYHEIYPNAPAKEEIRNYTMEALLRRSLDAGLIEAPLAKKDPDEWLAQALASRRNKDGGSGETTHSSGRTYFFRYGWTTEGGMILLQTDITERKKIEEALKENERKFRMALDNMPGAMQVVDKDMRIVFVNDIYIDFYGDPNGLLRPGGSMADVLRSEIERGILTGDGAPETILETRLASYRTDAISVFEDRTPDGRFIQLTRTPAPDGHTVSVSVDITERKRAEQVVADAMALVNESIQYASRIQRSVLPSTAELADAFADCGVIWEPRDMVGGDIYLLRRCEGGVLLLVADCTGHGVPGAFMTLIVAGALDQALQQNKAGAPADLLYRMNRIVKYMLSQNGPAVGADGESDDGFECALCRVDAADGTVAFAGARMSLWMERDGDIQSIPADKVGIGYRRTDSDCVFVQHEIPARAGDRFFVVSDGMLDQIGGPRRRAYGKKRCRTAITSCNGVSLPAVLDAVRSDFSTYQGDEARRDDVTFVGFQPV